MQSVWLSQTRPVERKRTGRMHAATYLLIRKLPMLEVLVVIRNVSGIDHKIEVILIGQPLVKHLKRERERERERERKRETH